MKKAIAIGTVLVLVLSIMLVLPSCSSERGGAITLEGRPLTLVGSEIQVGQKAPDFKLLAPFQLITAEIGKYEVSLSQSQGKARLINVVPSLDTPVCDLQTQTFEAEAGKLKDVVVYTVSMDLPFAQARYCGARNISTLHVLSDYLDGSFGHAYGVLIKELRLLSRAVFIIDREGIVRYVEYVKEISGPPDFDKAAEALKKIVGA